MAFQSFTGKDYLKIDIANNFGLDKLTWDERIHWFNTNEHQLDSLLKQAEEPALYYAGVQAWKKTKKGKASGYPISLDATSSGIQILAALACDRKTALLCNVVDSGRREDAYTGLYNLMCERIGDGAKIDRKLTKQAIMTAFYGSTATPREVFGKGSALLDTFYKTMEEEAPGAWEINHACLVLWDPTALTNDWVLPDNFHVKIKVMGQASDHVQFLNEPFEVTYHQNMPIEEGRSLGANLVHSIDGMVVREMVRRCNYDPKKVEAIKFMLRVGNKARSQNRPQDRLLNLLWTHYQNSGFLSARIIELIDADNVGNIPHVMLHGLIETLPKKPFEVLAVHDCFRCLPNYGNDLRRQYNNLLAEISESDLLSNILSQITGRELKVNPMEDALTLSRDIREANYALS